MRKSILRSLLAAALVTAWLLPASTQPAPQRATRVFISADMEGITGVVQPAQLGPSGFEYARAREWMTAEVKAAIEGARAAGATEFVVADSHGNAQNLLIDQLPEDARVVRGFPRPLSMMQGIDPTFGAAIFIGYHGSEFGADAVRGHTFSSARLLGVKLHGEEVSEGIFNAAIAGHFGVPVAFVSGDKTAVSQLQRVVPNAEGVIVKEGLGYHSAISVTPARGQAMIREGVRRALGRLAQIQPYRVKTPVDLEVGFKATLDAERISYLPGIARVDAHTVRTTLPDMLQVVRLTQVMSSLEQPQ
jgi:D-amino peptidase